MENKTELPLTTTTDKFMFTDESPTRYCCICHGKIEYSLVLTRTHFNHFKEIDVGQCAHLECYIERCVQRSVERNSKR